MTAPPPEPQTDLLGDPQDPLADDLPGAAASLSETPERWPDRIAEMVDWVVDEAARSGLMPAPADRRTLAVRVVTRICAEIGGAQYYWPKTDAIRRALRDATIWAEHDGTRDGPRGITALSRRHHLSEVQVWAILRAQRALHVRRVQGRLDLPPPA